MQMELFDRDPAKEMVDFTLSLVHRKEREELLAELENVFRNVNPGVRSGIIKNYIRQGPSPRRAMYAVFQEIKYHGSEFLGKGVFAFTVAVPDEDKVVKVCRGGDGYNQFIRRVVLPNQHIPFFPKVYHVEELTNGYGAYVLERLVDMDFTEANKICPAMRKAIDWNLWDDLEECEPNLVEAVEIMSGELPPGPFNYDLHDGNIMVRPGDFCPVITDPVANI